MSAEQQGPHDRFESVAAALAARVQSIVEAAEREAAAVQVDLEVQRRQAEEERRTYLAAARTRADSLARQRLDRLHELTESLVARAELARRQLDELVALLGEASGELHQEQALADELMSSRGAAVADALTGTEPAPPPSAPAPLPPEPEPELEPEMGEPASVSPLRPAEEPPAPEPSTGDLDAARLAAIQMAVAGSTRDEVQGHLRERFGLEDVTAILDDVFGTGSPGSSRMSWGPA
jgi:hypothetical protein